MKQGKAKSYELESPSQKEFQLPSPSVDFFHDEEELYDEAKTRFGEESARIAILPKNLYNEAIQFTKNNFRIPSELAKQIMMYSINVRYSTIDEFLNKYKITKKEIKGSGKLSGVYLFCSLENDILPEQTITACINDGCITVDREIGLIM